MIQFIYGIVYIPWKQEAQVIKVFSCDSFANNM